LAEAGLVLEENLSAVTTYSIGQVRGRPHGILLRHAAPDGRQCRR
jgi:hypothetical protein